MYPIYGGMYPMYGAMYPIYEAMYPLYGGMYTIHVGSLLGFGWELVGIWDLAPYVGYVHHVWGYVTPPYMG